MTQPTDFRQGPDRRRQPRGGRRAGDADGFAPLVLLVGDEDATRAQAETILAKLKFAVSTCTDAAEAIRLMPALRPELIVAEPLHEPVLRAATHLPIVLIRENDSLVEDVRRALRVTPIP